MAKQLNVDLRFNADTQAAKRSINQLAMELEKLSKPHKIEGISSESLKAASKAAQELQGHLQNAVNVNTGKLDLSKFSQSLSRSNTDIQSLALNLSRAGSQGQQAFASLVRNINMADKSMIGLGAKMTDFATTLKNTARWQISSSILHGFMGTISSALGYAERLNTSLNNIRIVTGQSVDQMAAFAEKANAAAKALSTTTTAYTDAALIYYQQGLTGKAVEERAETTLKLANVSRQSAETVSQQMTGIWNNFDDGSKSLEYYADVLTKLGATTASSTQEIATGLEKFAAIADTVGLSYEHAAAALATITATTRQSADVVGTALKTLFARIQDLEVGKTLDDGTTLGKYSQALAAIGVQIKDANGEVRSMDDILDDMGGKWDTLSKDMQIAVAQTVAGTRQYTQLMALMDNWDFMQKNLATARGAEGELQRQADVYAESWEAAQKRVRASAESIFSDLLNDKFFIGMNNGLAGFLNILDNVIDGFGGLQTVIMGVASIFMSKFAKEIPAALNTLKAGLNVVSGQAEKNQQLMFKDVNSIAQRMMQSSSAETAALGRGMALTTEMSAKLQASLSSLSKAEIAEAQAKIQQVQAAQDYIATLGREIDSLQAKSTAQERAVAQAVNASTAERQAALKEEISLQGAFYRRARQEEKAAQQKKQSNYAHIRDQGDIDLAKAQKDVETYRNAVKAALAEYKNFTNAMNKNNKSINAFATLHQKVGELKGIFNEVSQGAQDLQTHLKDIGDTYANSKADPSQHYQKVKESLLQYAEALAETTSKESVFGQEIAEIIAQISNFDVKSKEAGAGLTQIAQKLSDLGFRGETESTKLNKISLALEKIETKLRSSGADPKLLQDIKQINAEIGKIKAESIIVTPKLNMAGFAKHLTTTSEMIGKVGSQLMNLGMAISAIQQLGSIWSNDDLTIGQKLLQTVSALSMVLISVGPMLAGIATGFKAIATAESLAAAKAAFFASSILPILALTAALVGIIALIGKIKDDMHDTSLEGQLEKATAKTEAFSQALQDVQNKTSELHSLWDEYVSVQETLASCEEGSYEWYTALNNVNQIVNELLNKFPELAQYLSVGPNGELRLDEKGYKQADQNQQQNEIIAGMAYQQASTEKRAIELEVERDNLSKQLAQGKGSKADAGLLIDNWEEILGSTDRVGTIRRRLATSDSMAQAFNDKLTPEMQANLTGYSNNVRALQNQQDIFAESQLKQALNTSAINTNAEYADTLAKAFSPVLQDILNDDHYITKSNLDNNTSEARSQAAEALSGMGKEVSQVTAITGDEVKYKDLNNQEQTAQLDAVAAFIDLKEGMQATTKNMETASTALSKLEQNAERGSDENKTMFNALEQVLSKGSLDGLTADQAKLIIELSDSGKTKEVLEELDGGTGQLSKLMASLGQTETDVINTIDNAAERSNKVVTEQSNRAKDIISDNLDHIQQEAPRIGKEIPDIMKGINNNLDSLNKEAVDNLENNFDAISKNLSQKSADAIKEDYLKNINNLVSLADPNKQGQLLNDLLKIDPTNIEAMNEFQAALDKAGLSMDELGLNSWDNYLEGLAKAIDGTTELTNVITSFGDIITALNGLEFGGAVDKDTIDTLRSYIGDIDDLFVELDDGTQIFIGNAESAKNAVMQSYQSQKQAILDAKSAVDSYNESLKQYPSDNPFTGQATDMKQQQAELMSLNTSMRSMIGISGEDFSAIEDADKIAAAYEQVNGIFANANQSLVEMNENLASAAVKAQDMEMLNQTFNPEDTSGEMGGLNEEAYSQYAAAILASTEDTEQLKQAIAELQIPLSELPLDTITALGDKFTNARDEALRLKEAIQESGEDSEQALKAAKEMSDAMSGATLGDEFGMNASDTEAIVDSMRELNDELAEADGNWNSDAKAAQQAAERYIRLNKAVEDITDNYDDYVDVLKDVQKETTAEGKAMVANSKNGQAFQKSLADLLNTSEDLVDARLIDAIDPKDFQAAANGSEDAINRIRDSFIDLQATDLLGEGAVDQINQFKDALADLDVGDAIPPGFMQGFLDELANAAAQAGMTTTEIEQMFKGMGIDCDVTPAIDSLNQIPAAAAAAGAAAAENASTEATIVEDSQTATDTKQYNDVQATALPAVERQGQVQYAVGSTTATVGEHGEVSVSGELSPRTVFLTQRFPGGVQYSSNPLEVTEEKTETAHAVKVENAHKGGGGKVNKKNAGGGGGGGRRGGGGGRRCFVAGTLVSTFKGYKAIEDLKVGDTVLSYNEKLRKNEYSQVLQIMIHDTIELFYTLHIEDETITSTGTHPFYIVRNGYGDWIEVQDVNINDLVMFADGTLHKIIDIDIDIMAKRVYNLEVSGNHNYYVGLNQILVHNKGGGRRRGGGGGGSSRAMTTAQSALTANDIDRYHVTSKRMDSISHKYNLLEKARNRTFGNQSIKNLKEEIKLMQQEIDLQKQYYSENRSFIDSDKLNLVLGTKKQWEEQTTMEGSSRVKSGYMGGLIDLVAFASRKYPNGNATTDTLHKDAFAQFYKVLADNFTSTIMEAIAKDTRDTGYISVETGDLIKAYLTDTTINEHGPDQALDIANKILGYRDDSGVAFNWQELQEQYLAELNRAEEAYNTQILAYEGLPETDERKWEVEQLKIARDRIGIERDEFQKLIDQLEESVALQKEIQEQYEDFVDTLQEVNLAYVREHTEQRQNYLDHMKTIAEQTMAKIEDDFTKIPEVMALIYDADNPKSLLHSILEEGDLWKEDWDAVTKLLDNNVFNHSGQLRWVNSTDQVKDKNDNIIDLDSFNKNYTETDPTKLGISYKMYMDELTTYFEKYSEKIEELIDIDKELGKYYLNALQGAAEYMDKFVSRLDRSLELNDHYKNLIGLMGRNFVSQNKNYDYQKYMDKYFDTQSKVLKSNMAAEQKRYAMLRDQYKQVQEEFNAAKDSYSIAVDKYQSDATETNRIAKEAAEARKNDYENMLFDLEEQVNESQDRIFENAAAQIENAQEKCEMAIEEIFRTAENSNILTNGLGFDTLSTSMDLATQHADNYLTKYRQIYETTTFLNKIQADIDKTENNAAKTRLNNFAKRIESMQKAGELSVWELETEKARYEQLQAQIALEEAQNAKSTVRLQRDSEGNYGYVYTADQDKIDDAKQALLDATNNIYELEEGYKDEAIQAVANLESEWFAATQSLVEMYQNGEINHEEYSRRLQEINNYYHQNILDQQEKFNFASEILDNEFNEGRLDTWSGSYIFLIDHINDASNLIQKTADDSEIKIQELDAVREEVFNNTDLGMQDLESTLNDLIATNAEYSRTLQEEVIPTMKQLLQRTLDQTKAYEDQRERLKEIIALYEQYQQKIADEQRIATTKYDGSKNYDQVITEFLQANGYDLNDKGLAKLWDQRRAWIDTEEIKDALSEEELKEKILLETDWSRMMGKYAFRLPGVTNAKDADQGLIDKYVSARGQKLEAQGKTNVDNSKDTVVDAALKYAWGSNYKEVDDARTIMKQEVKDDFGGNYGSAVKQFFTWAAREGVKKWTPEMLEGFSSINPRLFTKIALRNDKITNSDEEGMERWMDSRELEGLLKELNYFTDSPIQDIGDLSVALDFFVKTIGRYGDGLAQNQETDFAKYPILKTLWKYRTEKIKTSNDAKVKQYANQTWEEWLQSKYNGVLPKGFYSGGFTGAWGTEGKLAILHEKELVLNKEDTENILDAVAMIRELSNAIDLRALSYAVGGGIMSPSIGNNSQVIEQQVSIQAEFPNATNHNEIEQAFTTLINRATQYAGVPLD